MLRRALTLGFALMVSAAASSASGQVQASRFAITVDGYELASFSKIGSLGSTSDIVEVTESTPSGGVIIRRLPGRVRYRDVTLGRVVSNDLALAAWRDQVELGQFTSARKNASIVAYNAAGEPVMRYELDNAWPSAIEVFTDPQSGVLMETLTLVCERVRRVAP